MATLNLTQFRVVTDVSWETVPSDQLFAEKGKAIVLGSLPWNLEEYAGKKYEPGKSILLRCKAIVPEDGRYLLGVGADWSYKILMDGNLIVDGGGCYPPSERDFLKILTLKAGEHVVDLYFSRGQATATMCFSLKPWECEHDASADLTVQSGKIRKELHGANTVPYLSGRGNTDYDEPLRKLNFTFARTHDVALWNGGQRVVDTHFIFPLMKLDPKDPTNYYFDATDELLRLTQEEGGMEVFYRLGTSIEHSGEKHFNAVPPKDYHKYAEVLAGIVRHYTRGWANGFHYNIRYWEIWNEPEGIANMWTAPFLETFVPFFVIVLKRLKSEFPELQFGGPALCGLNIPLFKALLKACKEEGVAPDFISWHSYSTAPGGLANQPFAGRRLLDELGFPNTKLCINEWHYMPADWKIFRKCTPEEYRQGIESLQSIDSGVYNLAVLIGWQDSPLDLGMWYGASWDSPAFGYRNVYKEYTKNYYSMELFGMFLRDYPVKCPSQGFQPFILAAASEDSSRAGLLIADFKGAADTLEISVKGLSIYKKISAVVLDETRNNEPCEVTAKQEKLIIRKAKPGSAAYLIRLEK